MNKCGFLPNYMLIVALLLTACAAKQPSTEDIDAQNNSSEAVITQRQQNATVTPDQFLDFADWKAKFRLMAIEQGYEAMLVDALITQMQYQEQVVSLDRSQPEFSKMIWTYLDTAVSNERVATGRQKYLQTKAMLEQLEKQYGIPGQYLVAIWGLESAYGGFMGKKNLPSALATLAYDGRRTQFAQAQLLALLDLLSRGDLRLEQLQGSWAGGMGHTQFIPTTYQHYGVDGDGDGQRSPWNVNDALASTAHYLSQSGWQSGLSWGQEVKLPVKFDYQLVGQKHDLGTWLKIGITPITEFPKQHVLAKLWLPAGYQGPAFLLYPNHEVIKVYNNSSSYALAVGLLADEIAGNKPLQQSWPREAKPLSTLDFELLQTTLNQLGYDAGTIDGILGSKTRQAFQQWQLANGEIGDGFVSKQSVKQLIP